MSKSICALAHKSGSTREAFQRYYEERHVPLAIGFFPFSAYARNHVAGMADFRWDTISEFWADDIGAAAQLMNGPIGATMAADEERFMNRSLIASAAAEEIILSPGDRASADGRRTALLVDGAAGGADWRAAVLGWAGALARSHDGVSVDLTSNWTELAFPAAAMIWLPGWHDGYDTREGLSARTLLMRHVQTPPSDLLGNRRMAD